MKISVTRASAICTFLCAVLLALTAADALASESENIARYRRQELRAGAKTLPVLSRLAYRDAIASLGSGNMELAEKQLLESLDYDPQFVDPYFTLAQVKLRQIDPDAAIYFVQAFVTIAKSFRTQSLLIINLFVAIPYVLILVCLIVSVAMTGKYLPFAAHRLKELLQKRFHAALPGVSTNLMLLLPVLLLPGFVVAIAYLTLICWLFMYRRERFLMSMLFLPFIAFGVFGSFLRPLTPLSDPKSLTSLVAYANESAGDPRLIQAIDRAEVEGLEAQKNTALGLLYHRSGQYSDAADYFFRAISLQPKSGRDYINLGNVYFRQGLYEKALEGYRKAEDIEPMDPVGQYALAQAYIETMLMKEASQSLQLASALGLERVKSSYAKGALLDVPVLPKTLSNAELWRMAYVESRHVQGDILNDLLWSFSRSPREASGWFLLATLIAAMILSAVVDPSKLTFQCSNCGKLTCESCCNTDREMYLCRECAGTIEGVTSEKVSEALLRQKRQAVVVSRRKSSRFVTTLFPGMRDISYGRISRGFLLATLFSLGVVEVFSRGFIIKDDLSLIGTVPLWKTITPVAAIVLAYLMSFFTKPQYSFRAYRPKKSRIKEISGETRGKARVA